MATNLEEYVTLIMFQVDYEWKVVDGTNVLGWSKEQVELKWCNISRFGIIIRVLTILIWIKLYHCPRMDFNFSL